MRTLLVLMALALAFAACSSEDESTPAASPDSGIRGTVLAGPTCPVETPQSPCPDRPLTAAPIQVKSLTTGSVTTAHSDANGQFRLVISPGKYEVKPLPFENQSLPAPGPAQEVSVQAGNFADVTVTYDTGIR
jgi:hypothetical protein